MARMIWETLKRVLRGSFPLAMLPSSVDAALIAAPQKTPNKSVDERWIMKEIDPLAASRTRVVNAPSNKAATSRNDANGHQPGKGAPARQPMSRHRPEAATIRATKPLSRTFLLGIKYWGRDPIGRYYCQPSVSERPNAVVKYPTALESNRAAAVSQLIINMSVTPLRVHQVTAGKWLASR